jgi:hypothetical protein
MSLAQFFRGYAACAHGCATNPGPMPGKNKQFSSWRQRGHLVVYSTILASGEVISARDRPGSKLRKQRAYPLDVSFP